MRNHREGSQNVCLSFCFEEQREATQRWNPSTACVCCGIKQHEESTAVLSQTKTKTKKKHKRSKPEVKIQQTLAELHTFGSTERNQKLLVYPVSVWEGDYSKQKYSLRETAGSSTSQIKANVSWGDGSQQEGQLWRIESGAVWFSAIHRTWDYMERKSWLKNMHLFL